MQQDLVNAIAMGLCGPHSTQKDFNGNGDELPFHVVLRMRLTHIFIFFRCCAPIVCGNFYDFMADKAKTHNSEQEMWRRQCFHIFRLRTNFHLGISHVPRYSILAFPGFCSSLTSSWVQVFKPFYRIELCGLCFAHFFFLRTRKWHSSSAMNLCCCRRN